MKKLLSVVICILMIASSINAFADGSDDVKLGMIKNEVIETMGYKGSTNTITSTIGKLDCLIYKYQKLSQYDDAALNLAFMKDKLVAKTYGFLADKLSNHFLYLKKALTKKYGNYDEDYNAAATLMEVFGAGSLLETMDMKNVIYSFDGSLCTWKNDDGSYIVLLSLDLGDDPITLLSYMAPLDEIEEDIDYTGL